MDDKEVTGWNQPIKKIIAEMNELFSKYIDTEDAKELTEDLLNKR